MGQVDLNFRPSVPVFDANVALGRRHDRRVEVDSVEGTFQAMRRAGIDRAVVHSPHAVGIDTQDGNELLLDMTEGHSSLVPQFVCNPAYDNLDAFADEVSRQGVRSVRMAPKAHSYPLRNWIVKPWFTWMADVNIPLWLPADEIEPAELHDTLAEFPATTVVLCEVHWTSLPWALPLIRSLRNVHIEISRFMVSDGIVRLLKAVGHKRIIYGSRFPDSPMEPLLYMLQRCGLKEEVLRDICSGNLSKLLGE